MGLFGLFATMVGLGAMAKDGISNSISTEKSYQKAKANNDPTYYGAGSAMYYTKTGQRCSKEFKNGHVILNDLKTGKMLEDITLTKNRIKQQSEKNALPNGCVFYRVCDWDLSTGVTMNIWASDMIPGFFRKCGDSYSNKVDMENDIFKRGDINLKFLSKNQFEVTPYNVWDINGVYGNSYYPNGVKVTPEDTCRKLNEKEKKKNIANGKYFYLSKKCEYYEEEFKGEIRKHVRFVYNGLRDIEKDEEYTYNKENQYYIRCKKVVHTEEITKPHHKDKEIIETIVEEEIEGAPRYNADGTEWVE